MIWAAVALAAVSGIADARPDIVRAQLAGDSQRALELAELRLAESPEEARAQGLAYLRAHLLESLSRQRDADEAFAQVLADTPLLAAHSRYRLALNQTRDGHPEVAAGLLASMLAKDPPASLVRPAAKLLFTSLEQGGDCRLLRGLDAWRLDRRAHRLLRVARSRCQALQGDAAGIPDLVDILDEDVRDEPGRLAADLLSPHLDTESSDQRQLLLVGKALHHQRRFDLAADFLQRGLARAPTSRELRVSHLEARYALARSHFWRQNYLDAAAEFGRVAADSEQPLDVARALYQQGRSFELEGARDAAVSSFRMAYLEDPTGRFADAALLSTLRLELQRGNEDEAVRLLETLASRRDWSRLFAKAAVFMASSDIVRGRADRATDWLSAARRADRNTAGVIDYWRGRLAELERQWSSAASAFVETLAADPYGPLGGMALSRLSQPELARARRELVARLSAARGDRDLYRAWLLTDPDERARLDEKLRPHYAERAAAFFRVAFVDPGTWSIWTADLRKPEDVLLSLGIWSEGAAAVPRHFPPSKPPLGYTGSRLLVRGGMDRQALRIAETLVEGAHLTLPAPFVPSVLRRAAYPLPFGSLIAEEAARYGIEPFLLAAIIREESRFDPLAVSGASARGLTQLTLPTAQRLADTVGLPPPSADDLLVPRVSVALGAAYLGELSQRFAGRRLQILAAYNAGERQAELWRGYCFSDDEDEFLSKVGFPETRHYLDRVTISRNQYADLYPAATLSAHSSAAAEPSFTGATSDSGSSR